MDKKELTTEQAEKLLRAIFGIKADNERDEDEFPETDRDKVVDACHMLALNLEHVGRSISRLYRLSNLMAHSERDDTLVPPIIIKNELRMALEPLLKHRNDVNEITKTLWELYTEQN